MAWATIEIILLYNKTNSCLSSTIEKVVYLALVWQKLVSEKLFIQPWWEKSCSEKSCLFGLGRRRVGLRKVAYSAWVGERLFIRPGSQKKKNVYLA